MKKLSKEEMKKLIGGMKEMPGRCTGKCSGGDSSPWSMGCGKGALGDCVCPRLDAITSNCKMTDQS